MNVRTDVGPSNETRGWRLWYLAWVGVGAGLAFGLVGLASIGLFILPVAITLAAVVATRRGAGSGAAGVLAGLSLPLFYIAWNNRDGPGSVCWVTETGGGCSGRLDPMPFLFVAVVLVVSSVLAQWLARLR